jgi:haloalkane dehalogenase
LQAGVESGLADVDRAVYFTLYAFTPYATPESRRPLLQWPREIPIDG